MPVAVGTAGMSSVDACAKAAQGLKGKLVEVLQVYRDCLCEYICWGVGKGVGLRFGYQAHSLSLSLFLPA